MLKRRVSGNRSSARELAEEACRNQTEFPSEEEFNETVREVEAAEAAEDHKLRELGRGLPGPETVCPRDKIFRYLMEVYGFDKRTLWDLSLKDMKLYIEARPPRQKRDLESAKEEWRSASEAVAIAAERGYNITLDWVSKRKKALRTRPPRLPGCHQLEVEMSSLAVLLFTKAKRKVGEPDLDEPDDSERGRIEAQKRVEHERKRGRKT